MDVRLALAVLVTAAATASIARWWWPEGMDDKGSRLADLVWIPVAAGVIAARVATVLIQHPAGIASLREVTIIRGGTEFWIGVAAGCAAVGLTVRYTHRIMPRLALIAPFGLIAYGVYQAACVIQDGCPGPSSPIGLLEKGIDQRVFPVGLVEGVVAVAAGLWWMRRESPRSPIVRVAILLGSLVLIRMLASAFKPSLGDFPSRDQLSGLIAGVAVVGLLLYAWFDSRRWPVGRHQADGDGVRTS